jgi:hypothetical protein
MRKPRIYHDDSRCPFLQKVRPTLRPSTQFPVNSSSEDEDYPPHVPGHALGVPHVPLVPHLPVEDLPPVPPPLPARPQTHTRRPLRYIASPQQRKRKQSLAKFSPKTRTPDSAAQAIITFRGHRWGPPVDGVAATEYEHDESDVTEDRDSDESDTTDQETS